MILPILAILVVSSLMIFAALKMKRLQAYWLAVAASILAIVISPGPDRPAYRHLGVGSVKPREVRAAFAQNRAKCVRGASPNQGRDQQSEGWNWLMWRPCQSSEVRDIYANLTDAEKAKLMWQGLLFGGVMCVVMGTVPVLLASFPARGLLIIGVLMLIVAILALSGRDGSDGSYAPQHRRAAARYNSRYAQAF